MVFYFFPLIFVKKILSKKKDPGKEYAQSRAQSTVHYAGTGTGTVLIREFSCQSPFPQSLAKLLV